MGVERTVSYAKYERQTSEVATLRRGQMLERKIEREMQREPLLTEEIEKVSPDPAQTD